MQYLQMTHRLFLGAVLIFLNLNSAVAETCDEDDADVVTVSAKELWDKEDKEDSYKKALKRARDQAVDDAFLQVNPTQRSVRERIDITADSKSGARATTTREYSGSHFSRRFIKTRSIKELSSGPSKIDEFYIVEGKWEIAICKIEKEDITHRVAVGPIFFMKVHHERYRTTVVEGMSSAKNERIDYFKATGAKDLANVKVRGSVDSARSFRCRRGCDSSIWEIDVRVCLIAHIQLEHKSIMKCKRIHKNAPRSRDPRSRDELISVMDILNEAFEKAAVALGEKLVKRLL